MQEIEINDGPLAVVHPEPVYIVDVMHIINVGIALCPTQSTSKRMIDPNHADMERNYNVKRERVPSVIVCFVQGNIIRDGRDGEYPLAIALRDTPRHANMTVNVVMMFFAILLNRAYFVINHGHVEIFSFNTLNFVCK